MSRLTDLTFEEWVEVTFGYPSTGPASSRPTDRWREPPSVAVDYLIRACENAAEVFAPYPNDQLGEAFWRFPLSPFNDLGVPWERRQQGIRSIYTLFEQCFARRCEDYLSHTERGSAPTDPLNGICYMWWDIRPIIHGLNPARAVITAEYLDVLRRTLLLDSRACQESALHGLSHGHLDFGRWRNEDDPRYGIVARVEETTAIIDTFLAVNPELDPELKRYALAAREGRVQ